MSSLPGACTKVVGTDQTNAANNSKQSRRVPDSLRLHAPPVIGGVLLSMEGLD